MSNLIECVGWLDGSSPTALPPPTSLLLTQAPPNQPTTTPLSPKQPRRRETLTGDATIRYFDHLQDFAAFDGVLPNLFTEVSTSLERSFAAVDFVDSPGLVDGDMKYPMPVEVGGWG